MINKLKSVLKLFKKKKELSTEEKIDLLFKDLGEDTIKLVVGSDLVDFGTDICDKLSELRNSIFEKSGFIFPPIRILDSTNLQENELYCTIRGNEIYRDFIIPNKDSILDEIEKIIYYIFDNNLEEIFTYEIFEKYLDFVRTNNSGLVYQLTCRITVTQIKKLFVELIKEGKSVKNAVYIFEKIADNVLDGDLYGNINLKTLSKELIECL